MLCIPFLCSFLSLLTGIYSLGLKFWKWGGSWHLSHLRVKSPACPIFWSRTKAAFQVPAVLAELRLDVYVITFPHTLSTENFWVWTSSNQSQEVSKGHCSTNTELCFTVLTSAKMHEQTPFAAAKRKPLSKIHCSSAFWVFWHIVHDQSGTCQKHSKTWRISGSPVGLWTTNWADTLPTLIIQCKEATRNCE